MGCAGIRPETGNCKSRLTLHEGWLEEQVGCSCRQGSRSVSGRVAGSRLQSRSKRDIACGRRRRSCIRCRWSCQPLAMRYHRTSPGPRHNPPKQLRSGDCLLRTVCATHGIFPTCPLRSIPQGPRAVPEAFGVQPNPRISAKIPDSQGTWVCLACEHPPGVSMPE